MEYSSNICIIKKSLHFINNWAVFNAERKLKCNILTSFQNDKMDLYNRYNFLNITNKNFKILKNGVLNTDNIQMFSK